MDETKKIEYIPIPIETLKLDTIKSFDLFIKTKQNRMVLYNTGGDLFTLEVRNKLIENGISVLFINERDIGAYNTYLAENLTDFLSNPELSGEEKAEFAYSSISNIGHSLFDKPSEESIDSYKTAIKKTMDFVLREKDAITNLINLIQVDFTTYNHSMNVGIFATGLSKILFAEDDAHNLNEIAAGFFLHDIGKSEIPLSIIQKPGPLSPEEWEIMKRHPQKGFDILNKFDRITPESQVIVLQHHERQNGNGYPDGLMGKNIHIYSKTCCIADVFEALISKRPYKKQKSFFEALTIMKEEMHEEFDPEFFKQFILLFSEHKIKHKQY